MYTCYEMYSILIRGNASQAWQIWKEKGGGRGVSRDPILAPPLGCTLCDAPRWQSCTQAEDGSVHSVSSRAVGMCLG